MSDKIRLKDIAEKTEVSIVTVSNALSGKKGVSPALRKNIIQTAREMGFDFAKYMNRSVPGKSISVIMPAENVMAGTSFYWQLYQKAAKEISKNEGFTILELVRREDEEEGRIPSGILEMENDAVLLIGSFGKQYMRLLREKIHIPIVLLDCMNNGISADAVVSDNYNGVYRMTKYLMDAGHREIGFVGSRSLGTAIDDRYFGYRKAHAAKKIGIRKEWVLEDRDSCNGERKIRLPEQLPTAFVCSSDYSALILSRELAKRGLRVPEDISVVGFDDLMEDDPFFNSLTTYHVDMDRMCEEAVRMLMGKILHESEEMELRHIDGRIIERASVKKLRK